MSDDLLKTYLFADRTVRVVGLNLEHAWQAAHQHQQYPESVARLLGELTAAGAMLAANLKFDGSLLLQAQGDGPLSLIVVECRADKTIRAMAKLRENQPLPEHGGVQAWLNPGGQGQLAVILDPSRKQPGQHAWQGLIPLEGDTIAEVLEQYMAASEQLDTRIWLEANEHQASGLLLQRLPDHGGALDQASETIEEATDTWDRACHLASTLRPGELLQTDTDTLMHRLFWEESLLAFEPQPVRWHCTCSRDKVLGMLRMLGTEELRDMIAERDGDIDVRCDFCGKPYHLDSVDSAALVRQLEQQPDTSEHGRLH